MKRVFLVQGVHVDLITYMNIKLGCYTLEQYLEWINPQPQEHEDFIPF